MPKEVRHACADETVSASGTQTARFCSKYAEVHFLYLLSAKSLPEIPNYVRSPPPQQEVNVRTERTEELMFSVSEMP